MLKKNDPITVNTLSAKFRFSYIVFLFHWHTIKTLASNAAMVCIFLSISAGCTKRLPPGQIIKTGEFPFEINLQSNPFTAKIDKITYRIERDGSIIRLLGADTYELKKNADGLISVKGNDRLEFAIQYFPNKVIVQEIAIENNTGEKSIKSTYRIEVTGNTSKIFQNNSLYRTLRKEMGVFRVSSPENWRTGRINGVDSIESASYLAIPTPISQLNVLLWAFYNDSKKAK